MPALVKLLAAAAPAAEPDADLLARFVATRDDTAFAELVRRHGPAVYGTCRRLVGPAAADDAFQATFLVLAARAGSVRKAASVGSWLVGVAGRVARRMRLREDRRQKTEDRWKQTAPAFGAPADLCLLSSDLSTTLADEFTRLPDRLRAAAVACLVDGHTQEQAAAALGWSSRTVRRRLDEAKGLLRTRLERRGVTPAAAAAAVAAAGEAAALPAGLARRATDAATLFLAGGGADARAAALAHGVIGTMTTIRSTTAAACAAVLAGLGIGWANDAPQPAPKTAPAAKTTEPDRIPAPAAKDAPAAAGPHVHKTANFEVTAPTAAMARALGEAYERRRTKSALAWSGADLPAWKEPVPVRVTAAPPGPVPYEAKVRARVPGDDDFMDWVQGMQETFVDWHAPMLADRLVVRTLLGRRPPWWAEGALDWIANPNSPPTVWTSSVVPVRRQLEAGEARRLTALFVLEGHALEGAQAQAATVVGFLLSRTADPRPGRPLTAAEARRTLLRFLKAGGDSGWERAAKDVYGFASLAEMERAWIDWVRVEPGPPPDPDRIPPTNLTTPRAEPDAVGAATHLTANFAVSSSSIKASATIAEAAERHRKELAKRWLGKELPDAKEPLQIKVILTPGNSGGATTFTFAGADGKAPPGVRSAAMELRGPLDTVLKSVLPHEVMHVVLATHFGRPLPRWADEGIAVLAESDAEQKNHDVRARELLNAGRAIRLSTLFRMTDYPRDHIVLFAQGYSVCRFLLARGDREPALLSFLALGMGDNTAESWALAAREVYGFESIDALEQAWIDSLRPPPGGAAPTP